MFFKKAAPTLTKFKSPNAADITSKYPAKVQPAPGQTSSEYLQSLGKNQQSTEAVNFMANGMPERESTWWACQSSRLVEGKLNTADRSALSAAEEWVRNPTPETKSAAGAAAAKTDFTGPGAWSAQAAAWAPAVAPVAAPAAAVATAGHPGPAAAGLAASAIAGAVLLAAGLVNRPAMAEAEKPALNTETPPPKAPPLEAPDMPEGPTLKLSEAPSHQPTAASPAEQSKFAKTLQPFLDLGKDVASGKNTWA